LRLALTRPARLAAVHCHYSRRRRSGAQSRRRCLGRSPFQRFPL